MVLVLFMVSALVFVVFILVPGGDPASRMAGKNPTPQHVPHIRATCGFNPPFPDGEYVPLTTSPTQWAYHLILPWICLAVLFIGFYGRVLRSNMLDAMNEDYVRTAKAKGIDPRRVLLRHVLRNSLIPIVSLFGLDFAAVLGGGAILTETVFDLKGVGWYAAQSVGDLDLPPIMGVTLYVSFFIVVFSSLVDFMYAFLYPWIRPT